jgi:hypothetical protein
VTLDDLLWDEVMASVLRSAGYEPDEFREMAWNLCTPMARDERPLSGIFS